MYNIYIYIYIHIQYVCIFVSSAMLSTGWPCCLNGELLLEPQVWVNPKFFMGCLRLGGNARGLELGKVLQDVWLGGEMEIHGFPVKWSQKTWLFPYIYIYILICIYIYVYNWPDFALVQSIPMVMNSTILGRSDIFRGKYLLHGEHGHCFFFQSWQPDSVDDADRTSNGSSVARANSKTL